MVPGSFRTFQDHSQAVVAFVCLFVCLSQVRLSFLDACPQMRDNTRSSLFLSVLYPRPLDGTGISYMYIYIERDAGIPYL